MCFYADVREERLEGVSGICLERAQLLLNNTLQTQTFDQSMKINQITENAPVF